MVAEEDAFELNSYWSKLGLGLGQDMSSSSSTLIFITIPQGSSNCDSIFVSLTNKNISYQTNKNINTNKRRWL